MRTVWEIYQSDKRRRENEMSMQEWSYMEEIELGKQAQGSKEINEEILQYRIQM